MSGARGLGALALALVLASACFPQDPPRLAPLDAAAADAESTPDASPADVPMGTVRVAYPEEPWSWHPAVAGEPAAVDLAALWGLPLYRIDDRGQLRPGLATGFEEVRLPTGEWAVDVTLAPGAWSDGTDVTADDVVATVGWLASTREGVGASAVTATAVDDRTVRFTSDVRGDAWAYVLAGGFSVLPAALVASDPGDVTDPPTVSGGWFRVEAYEPGRRIAFAANPDGPMGAPGVERLEVEFVPSYETALGLLQDGEVDGVLGYLALNPVERAGRVAGVQASAPLGGTWVGIEWFADGVLGGDDRREERRSVVGTIRLEQQVEGLLQETGERLTTTIPGSSGPFGLVTPASLAQAPTPQLVVARWQEATGFSARAIQRDVQAFEGDLELVRLESDQVAETYGARGDGALVVRRDLPRPTLMRWVSEDLREAAVRADAGDAAATIDVLTRLADDRMVEPLYRIGVAHAWAPSVAGLTPSSWPGLAFWDAGRWRLSDP